MRYIDKTKKKDEGFVGGYIEILGGQPEGNAQNFILVPINCTKQ